MWIESHQELGSHPKTQKLARILGLSKPTVVGHLQYLWWWATDYAQDGDLSRFDALDIAIGGEFDGDADVFVDALVRAGFVDRTENGLAIHDWYEYAGRLIEQRELKASRARRNRGLYNDDELVRIVRTRDGDGCRYCGKTVNWKDRKGADGGTYDHLDPDAKPENTPENVVVACRSCNAAKGKRTPEQAGMVLLFPAGNPNGTAKNLPSSAVNQPNNLTQPNKTVPNQTKEDGGAKTRAPLPANGPAQVLVKTWADRSGVEPANYGKAAGQAAQLVKAGVESGELLEMFDWFAGDSFWQDKGFDLGSCVSQLEKFRQSKRTPRTHSNGRASPQMTNAELSAAALRRAAGKQAEPSGPVFETTGRIQR